MSAAGSGPAPAEGATALHPRTREVLDYLDERRVALERAVAAVPAELRDRTPGPDRWSVAEVLEHLARVEARVAALLAGLVASARERGAGPETEASPVIPTVDVARLLDRGRRRDAGEASRPRGGMDAGTGLAALRERRDALRSTLLAGDGLALSGPTAENPVLGPLNVYQWIVFVAAHEARHTLQIEEIAAELGRSR